MTSRHDLVHRRSVRLVAALREEGYTPKEAVGVCITAATTAMHCSAGYGDDPVECEHHIRALLEAMLKVARETPR